MTQHSGIYHTPDDLLAEFHEDPAGREAVMREAERLAARERGARLVELRERARASREEVARRMGVELAQVISLETGVFDLSRVDLSHLSGLEDSTAEELVALGRLIAGLSAYVQAIGGDVEIEITESDGRVRFLPAPAEHVDVDLLYAVVTNHKPETLKVVADLDGFRTEVA